MLQRVKEPQLRELHRLKLNYNLHYQPIIELKTGEVKGFESLLRATNSEGYAVPVLDVLAAIVSPIDSEHLTTETFKALDKHLPVFIERGFFVSVNFEQHQIAGPAFMINMRNMANRYGNLFHKHVVIEVTERVYSDSMFRRVISNVRTLQRFGYKIALDDFGLNAVDLELLSAIHKPFLVKVDKNVCHKELMSAFEAYTLSGKLKGCALCIEGVETSEQCELVTAAGFKYAQGYYFERPQPLSEIASLR